MRRTTFVRIAPPLAAISIFIGTVTNQAKAAIKLEYTETSLGRFPAGSRTDQIVFSADGLHMAYPVKRPGGRVVGLDGKAGPEHEWVLAGTLAFSPDGKRLAYHVQKGDTFCVVVDGVEGKPYSEVPSPHVSFSPDSKQVAYIARKSAQSKGVVVVVDGAEGKEFAGISPRTLAWSPDGKNLCFVVEESGKRAWMIGEKQGKGFDSLGPLEWSRDSSRWGHTGETAGRKTVIID